MTLLAYVLFSILLVTALAAAGRRAGLRRLCPICAGVALTWIGLLALRGAGHGVGDTLPALLMGASVVGALQALERRSAWEGGVPLWWKTAFVLGGIAGAYGLLHPSWPLIAGAAAVLAALTGWAFREKVPLPAPVPARPSGVETLTEQMKNCC